MDLGNTLVSCDMAQVSAELFHILYTVYSFCKGTFDHQVHKQSSLEECQKGLTLLVCPHSLDLAGIETVDVLTFNNVLPTNSVSCKSLN